MKTIRITLLALACAACNSSGQFKTSEQFEAALKSWDVADKSLSEATKILEHLDFACSGHTCSREVKGFPCLQKQQVFLEVNPGGRVAAASVFKLPDGRIPTACL